jgi:hypothetical protein
VGGILTHQLLRIRQGRLVPVVAVGDQHRPVGQVPGDRGQPRGIGDPPDDVALGAVRELALLPGRRRVQQRPQLLGQEPERLQAGPGGPEEGQPVLLGTTVGALVGQHHALLVRHQPEQGEHVQAHPAVELGPVQVHRRLTVPDQDAPVHPLVEPGGRPCIVVARPRQPDHVVGRAGPIPGHVLLVEHVVRRCHHRLQRLRVPQAAEGAHVSHGRPAPRSAGSTSRGWCAAAADRRRRRGRLWSGSSWPAPWARPARAASRRC